MAQKTNDTIDHVLAGRSLSIKEAEKLFTAALNRLVTPKAMREALIMMNEKGETPEEIVGAYQAVRDYDQQAKHDLKKPCTVTGKRFIDVCGTGGDQLGTFNISTTVAFVVAASGLPVAKHGNRAVSSVCGSSDVLLKLGVDITIPPSQMRSIFDEIGFAYLHAPLYHPSFKVIAPIREGIKRRTIFNLLGPLLNPYDAPYQVMGVYSENMIPTYANVLKQLKRKCAVVVHGDDGLDEASVTTSSRLTYIQNKKISTKKISISKLPFKRGKVATLKGGNNAKNAQIFTDVLQGNCKDARADIVALNAAIALQTGGACSSLRQGINLAKYTLETGAGYRLFEKFRKLTLL